MAGLREKQRADRDRRILEAAAALFREHGYVDATIERIARLAEVSVGTIYNYYKNKGDLLLAIVVMETNVQLKGGRVLAENPPRDLDEALHELMLVMLDNCTIYVNKEMWRHAMANATRFSSSPYGKTYEQLDIGLSENACRLMVRLQEQGVVRDDVDAHAAGECWFNNLNMMFTNFVKSDTMSLDDLKTAITRQCQPLIDAIRSDPEKR